MNVATTVDKMCLVVYTFMILNSKYIQNRLRSRYKQQVGIDCLLRQDYLRPLWNIVNIHFRQFSIC